MKTILMIDDNEQLLEILSRSLSQAGYHIIPVHSGEHALEMLQTMKPDLIISDIGLPGIDGAELCRRIRESPTYHDLPVMLLSGFDLDYPHQSCAPSAVLQKPVALDDLRAAIVRLLENAEHDRDQRDLADDPPQ